MAGLKKKKKEKSGSPNIVLVIFLVMFIISNITLGIFVYTMIEEKDNAKNLKNKADAALTAEKKVTTFYKLMFRELRTALGDTLLEDDMKEVIIDRDAFKAGKLDAGAPAKDKEAALALMKKLSETLDGASDKGFNKNYPDLIKEAEEKFQKTDGKINAALTQLKLKEDLLAAVSKNQKDIYDAAVERIDKGNAASLAEAKKRSAEFMALSAAVLKLNEDLNEKKDEVLRLKEEQDAALKLRDRELITLRAGLREVEGLKGAGGGGANLVRTDTFPLLLDISLGKPLWDNPIGKITRVDLDVRQVYINLGSHHGAKPELTFNIFAAGASGRAERQMKGTIEITKVLGPDSSLCRITSLFDAEGMEIPLGLQTRGRILRETDSPLREGDLLFNLFWGTHVAIAGIIALDETASSNPADQHRHVMNMVNLLERQGMTVDAYLDLTDGQIKGKISSKTRYLIVGDRVGEKKPVNGIAKELPKEMKDDPEKKDDPEMKKNADEKELGREGGIADAMRKLRDDATGKGVIQISSENFLNVIGYRRARNANTAERSNFRSYLPNAGIAAPAAVRDPMPPAEEKKAPPPEEKKDGN